MYHEGAESVNEPAPLSCRQQAPSGWMEAGEFEGIFDGFANRVVADSVHQPE